MLQYDWVAGRTRLSLHHEQSIHTASPWFWVSKWSTIRRRRRRRRRRKRRRRRRKRRRRRRKKRRRRQRRRREEEKKEEEEEEEEQSARSIATLYQVITYIIVWEHHSFGISGSARLWRREGSVHEIIVHREQNQNISLYPEYNRLKFHFLQCGMG